MMRARVLAMAGACFSLLAVYPGGGGPPAPATAAARAAAAVAAHAATRQVPTAASSRFSAPVTAFEAAATDPSAQRPTHRPIDLQRRNIPLDATPTVTGVSPNVGPSAGGTPITITGTSFLTTTDVFFGGTDITAKCPSAGACFSATDDNDISAVTPPETAGAQDITVKNDMGTSNANPPADQFTWFDRPTVTTVSSPQNEGATGINVNGSNFSDPAVGGDAVTDVRLVPTSSGSTVDLPSACTSNSSPDCFAFVTDTHITINLPASVAPGQYDVVVTTPGGTSNQSSNDFLVVQQAAPTVTSVTPDAGPTAGGPSPISIVGTDFEGSGFAATDVFFGNTDVTTFALHSATSITVTPPSGSGQEHVTVETQSTDGTAQQTSNTSPADTYVYAPGPAISGVVQPSGPTLGGNTVTLNGTGFESNNGTGANYAATKVSVAATNITATPCPGTPVAPCYTINSATQIVVEDFPAHAAGGVLITATTAGGTSTGAAYTYIALPTVTSVSPPSGPASGGNPVTVTGTAFANATDVFVAGNDIPSTAFTVNGPGTQISIAHFPAHAAGGPFDVTVATPGGTSVPSIGDHYTYDGVPTVTNVSPQAGPISGGNTVVVTGTAFSDTTDVLVGSGDVTVSPCPGSPVSPCFTVNGTGTQITIEDMPSGSAGPPVDITVNTPGGSNTPAPADTYVYAPLPTATSLSPPAGALGGGNTISVTGSNFQSSNGPSADYTVTAVSVGGIPATSFTVVSSTQVNVQVPAGSAGTASVIVTTQGGNSGAVSYTYAPVPTISSISPLAGPVAGGNTVTINGAGFSSGTAFTTTQVSVGGTSVTSACGTAPCFTVVSANQINVEVPANGGGTVPITVTTVGGTSTAAQYAYAPVPTVTSVSPNAGPPSGGSPVTINGTNFESTNGPGDNYSVTSVMVGSATCAVTTCFVVNSPTQISIASMPADLAGGIVHILVTTVAGTSTATSNDQYNYVTQFPTVSAVSPAFGPDAGGAILTISGTNFGNQTLAFHATKVSFGSTDVTTTPCPNHPTSACFNVISDSTIRVFTPPASAPGTALVDVTNPSNPKASNALPYTYVAPGTYTPLAVPFRICDTRRGSTTPACAGKTLGAPLQVQITGGQVPAQAQAVVVNLTVINHSATTTFVSAYPSGGTRPLASNVNVDPGVTQANLAVVALSSAGALTVFNSVGSADVVIDVQGYFAAPTGNGGTFHPLSPVRICDTRAKPGTTNCTTGALAGGTWRRVVVSGLPPGGTGTGIPPNLTAAAAVFNLTAVTPSAATFLAISPPNSSDVCPTAHAGSSNLNPAKGETEPNRVISNLGLNQDVCVYNSVGSVNFIIDVSGWFGSGGESTLGTDFYAVPPTRICDTRAGSGTQCAATPTSGSVRLIPVAGIKATPAIGGASAPVAIIGNLTGVAGTAATYLEVYPADATSRPVSSDLNPAARDVIANLDIVALATSTSGVNIDGNVDLFNSAGTINVIIDVAGWFQ